MQKDLLIRQARFTRDLLWEYRKRKNESFYAYLTGKMEAYREALYTLGMNHEEIKFELSL